ncbi:YdeI/OmpD-associated family protein [Algoriphagus limi]|uniref:YdeI/OmpD-associated family protein n=1 Tax=Algoriphagus limi TaxID=2975273 RepID=A0ABT2G6M4_9BACT|nr:YdeI/OmpD-associated family protein [Algoriphagus limi]MCS5490925.1 YdeI/OmpD-associated family protein [Algoriphagus limi]
MKKIFEGIIYLEKFSGKGGWTYARIPLTFEKKGHYFGMRQVSGKIDDYSFEKKHLMPLGDGSLFLPISKDIRKVIKKEAGDPINLLLESPETPNAAPEELIACLKDYPGKFEAFLDLEAKEKSDWLEFIYSSNTENQKAERIIQLLDTLGIK